MKNYLIAGLFIAIPVALFIGRWTAPKQEDPRIQEQVENLKRQIIFQDSVIRAKDKASRMSEAKADYYKAVAENSQDTKPQNKIIYEKAADRIDRYTPTELDSDLVHVFGRLYQDSLVRLPSRRP